MADVTEVIHKISYEVNDEALINATKAIRAQIVELARLQKSLDGYIQQLNTLSDNEVRKLDELIRKIDSVNKQLLSTASATKSSLTEVFKGVLKGLDLPDTLKDSVANYVGAIKLQFKELNRASKSAGVGFAAHMSGAAKIGKSSLAPFIKTVANVGKGLLSFTGFAGLAANVLLTFGENLFTSGKRAKVFSQEVKQAAEFAKKLGSEAGNEISNLVQLRSKIEDLNASYSDRLLAVQQIRSIYPDYFSNLTDEEILAGKVAGAYQKITQSIVASAKARVFDSQLDEIIKKVVATEQKIKDQIKQKGLDRVVVGEDQRSGLNTYSIRDKSDLENINDAARIARGQTNSTIIQNAQIDYDPIRKLIDQNDNLIKEANGVLANIGANNLLIQSLKPKLKKPKLPTGGNTDNSNRRKADQPTQKLEIKLEPIFDEHELTNTLNDIAKISVQQLQEKLNDQQLQLTAEKQDKLLGLENGYSAGLIKLEDYEKRKVEVVREYAIKQLEIEVANIDAMLDSYQKGSVEYVKLTVERQAKVLEATRLKNEGKTAADVTKATQTAAEEEEKKKQADKHKAEIQEKIDSYQELAKAVVEAYNTILQTQIDALDKEISIREKRVEAAKALAEKGNVAVLKMEEDRLQKAQKKRAEYAKKQQIVNAAITVSNAVAAVARAALEGGGFGSIATIAALLAALAAGYASVTSLSQDNAFADGVVGFNGRGGPRDDKNWVRISNGESVITAEGTRHNQALLEAINSGSRFNVLGMPDMPLLKQPAGIYQQYAYATTKDLNGLEQKFDEVVGAIEKNKMKQNIFFNEYGVGIMTEKAISKNRKRWK